MTLPYFKSPRQKKRLLSYAAATGLVLVTLLCRLALDRFASGVSSFLLFLGAVMASAWLGGTGPGLWAVVLSSLVGNFFFMMPRLAFGVGSEGERVDFGMFLGEGMMIALLAGQMHRARDSALADQEEARSLQAQLLRVGDEERRRIGHDLHDGLGQVLTGISLLTRRLQLHLTAAKSPDSAVAEKVLELARSALEWTHDLCRTLAPESNDLAESLKELGAHAEAVSSIQCSLQLEGDPVILDPTTSMHLYRIAQEAVSNAIKHGHASTIDIRLESSPGSIDLSIADNGKGIDSTVASAEGMGLRIMRYRARIIGAGMEIGNRAGGGTAVRCRYVKQKSE